MQMFYLMSLHIQNVCILTGIYYEALISLHRFITKYFFIALYPTQGHSFTHLEYCLDTDV